MLIYLSWECSLETTRKHGVGTYFHLDLKKKKATKQYFEVIALLWLMKVPVIELWQIVCIFRVWQQVLF